MIYALRWLMSLLFIVQMYVMMAIIGLAYIPYAVINRDGAWAGIHTYCKYVRFTAHWMVGLQSEIRGVVPKGEVIIASKHQSFFDIILICSVVPRPKFIMKKELKWAPLLGFYAWRTGCVPVDRGKKGRAIAEMKKAVAAGAARPADRPAQCPWRVSADDGRAEGPCRLGDAPGRARRAHRRAV